MKPVDILMNEHRLIEQVLDGLEIIVANAAREGKTDLALAHQAIDFLRVFADRCHHGKEEDRLFPALEQKGYPREGGPTGVMISEHEQGRGYIRYMLEAVEAEERGDRSASKWFVQNGNGYIHLLRNHIHKEDHCLFPMVDQVLNPDEQETLLTAFKEFERSEMGPGEHERCLRIAEELAEQLGVDGIMLVTEK